ncbi:MAG: C39 family peptidase [Myxococcales bacterium]|nr:C39 family peptidase [Myxococcales bacterium]
MPRERERNFTGVGPVMALARAVNEQGSNMRLANKLLAAVGLAFLIACGAADATDLHAPDEGAQGPGTAIPEAERAPAPVDAEPATGAESAPPPPPAPTPAPAAPLVKKVLDVTWYGQETYYWCGPGSTRMALGTRLQSPPSQTDLARFMGTTVNGTDHIGLVAKALNAHFGGGGYTSRPMHDPPTKAQRDLLKSDLLARIGSGYPIVANVISGWRPPGYPSGTIYHYVAVVGFDDGGDKVLIADPAAEGKGGGASWNNVSRTYWISLQDLGTWIGGKGYTG